jgi:hypothetical protein
MIGKREKIAPIIASYSLIGVHGKPPHSWGNYFSLYDPGDESGWGLRVWNFWAENLKAAKHQFLDDGLVEIIRYTNGCIIDDPRIPKDWYYNKLCFTGGPQCSLEEATEIYSIVGDPNNELEQFTDPVSYYAKRGSKYNPETGIITKRINALSRVVN